MTAKCGRISGHGESRPRVPLHSGRKVAPLDILLTGASGFVGRGLVGRWQEHRLFSLGRTPTQGTIHIAADLTERIERSRLPGRIDTVVHVATAQGLPRDVFGVNAAATLDLLEAAIPRGASRFVLVSTGGVYGSRE